MPDQTISHEELANILQRMKERGADEPTVRAKTRELIGRLAPDVPKEAPAMSRFGTGLYENAVEPVVGMVKTGARLLTNPGAAVAEAAQAGGEEGLRLYDLATKGNEGHSALNWLPIVGPGLARTADKMRSGDWAGAAGDMTGMAATTGLQEMVPGVLNKAAPALRASGLKLGKSVWKIRDPPAKMSAASRGGTDVDAGVNALIQRAADEGVLSPTLDNRRKVIEAKQAAGKKVEATALIPPPRPEGITRLDRLLPSQATGLRDIPLGEPPVPKSTMVVSPQRLRLSGDGDVTKAIRFQEGTGPGRPGGPSASRGGFPGDQVPAIQYLGEGGREGLTAQELGGPGVLRKHTPPQVRGGQPFDTVAKKDVIASIDQDIADARRRAAPTTGLEGLRGRWAADDVPDFVNRPLAREITKDINMRLAPRYHNALNDPVAVASEKGVARQLNETMRTDAMREANTNYGELKPLALAISHAAKRAGARELVGAGTLIGSLIGGPKGAVIGAIASHPITQGGIAQRLYNAGKVLPGMAAKLKASDLARAIQLGLLQTERSKQPQQ